ncbi:MAG: PilZ domain-containing protein [Nitrospirae bacterium]|nr:PilZ domain-containing protein [Nitrospirota bacterium]
MGKKRRSYFSNRKWYRYHFFGTAFIEVLKENSKIDATIADISFSGMGIYSPVPINKGKKVMVKISFINISGKTCEDDVKGRIDWQRKFGNTYLVGIFFDEELNLIKQPLLFKHLTELIDRYNWPQPYKDRRIAML